MIRLIFSFARGEELKYLSHLDLIRLFIRALRRAGIAADFSRGITPRPRLSLAVPLPVGVTAGGEYGEIFLKESISPKQFVENLNLQLPPGIFINGARETEIEARSLGALIDCASYRAIRQDCQPARLARWQAAAADLLAQPAIIIDRDERPGKNPKSVDIRPYIYSLAMDALSASEAISARMLLQVGSLGGVSPFTVLRLLAGHAGEPEEPWHWRIHREGLYIYGEEPTQPFPGGGNSFWIKRSL